MSSITATRTTRLRPPAAPTRTAAPRRTDVGSGFPVAGRPERPVLRIVADDDRAPVLTRITPAPSLEPARQVRLDDFFAPEYDGDEQRLELAEPRVGSVRLTRRGRLAVLVASLVAVLGLGFLAASGSMANSRPEPTQVVTVAPGQTLWDISAGAAAGGDVRSMMSHIETINHLDSTVLQAGQHLRIPQ
jgi:hypothetical protein